MNLYAQRYVRWQGGKTLSPVLRSNLEFNASEPAQEEINNELLG